MEPKSTTNGFVTSTTTDLGTDPLDSSHARYVVISGFPNIYPDRNISITLTTNPDGGCSGKKSVKAGEHLNFFSYRH